MELRKFGLIGDVHCEDKRLEAAIAFFQKQDIDTILCVGDIIDGYGDPNRTVELLKNSNIVTVGGNHDRWCLNNEMRDLPNTIDRETISKENREYLADLPQVIEFECSMGKLALCHGLLENDMAGVNPDDQKYDLESNFDLQELIERDKYQVIVNGHTHKKMVKTFGSLTIINAGTIKRTHEPCLSIVDFDNKNVEFFLYQKNFTITSGHRIRL